MFRRHTIPILILLLAAFFRFDALTQDARFHPDEALFATFARRAALNGAWMLSGPLDKPPLSIYAMALSMHFFAARETEDHLLDFEPHVGEFAARVPGVFASIILVAVMYALAKSVFSADAARAGERAWELPMPLVGHTKGMKTGHPSVLAGYAAGCFEHPAASSPLEAGLHNDLSRRVSPSGVSLFSEAGRTSPGQIAIVAMFLTAVSPFAIAFSATAFTDGLMLLWMALALLMAARGRWFSAGLLLALSIGSKQQGLLYVPLILLLSWAQRPLTWRRLMRVMIPLLIGGALLFAWDAARPGTGVMALAAANNTPGGVLAAPDDIIPRLLQWLGFARAFAGPGGLTALLVLVALATLPRRAARVDVALAVYIAGFGLVYTLVPFNTYDRYLLPVLPPAILLMSRGVARILQPAWPPTGLKLPAWNCAARARVFGSNTGRLPRSIAPLRIRGGVGEGSAARANLWRQVIALALFAPLLLAAHQAGAGAIHVGGDRGDHTGIDVLAAELNRKALGAIIYDRWLGWELDYYLGQWTDKRRVHYPSPGALAANAPLQPDPAPRYFVAPAGQAHAAWLAALQSAGFSVSADSRTARFVVYEVRPPPAIAVARPTAHDGGNGARYGVEVLTGRFYVRPASVSPYWPVGFAVY